MTIEITSSSEPFKVNIIDERVAIGLTAEAIRAIAEAIRDEASIQAPEGETGALKEHPVDIHHLQRYGSAYVGVRGIPGLSYGEIVTEFPSYGGGLTVRGAGGRFVKGGSLQAPGTRGVISYPGSAGHTVEELEITVAEEPHYAIWVHDGTGIYGKHHARIVPTTQRHLIFKRYGKKFKVDSVEGQRPNPYLERAFLYVNRTFVPARIEELRNSIRLYT